MKNQCLKGSILEVFHIHYNKKYPFLFYKSFFPSLSRIVLALIFQFIMDLQWASGPLLIITVSRTLDYQLDSLNSTLAHFRVQVNWFTQNKLSAVSNCQWLLSENSNLSLKVSCCFSTQLKSKYPNWHYMHMITELL